MSEKKGATCQSFIRKEITTYRIGTLAHNFRIKFSILVHYGAVSWEKLDSAAIRASNLHSDSSNPTVDLLKATTASS